MRKAFIGLVALMILGFAAAAYLIPRGALAQVGPPNQILCNTPTNVTGTGAAASFVTAGANQRVYLCGWHFTNTAATGTFAITAGTGTNCGTGTVNVTPTMSVTSTAPTTDHIEFATFNTVLGGSLCVNATVTTVAGVLWTGVY